MTLPLVLIVDDSLTVRMDLHEAFEAAGFRTKLCATVASAEEAIKEGGFALAILDIVLPDGDGFGLLSQIKSGALTKEIPVMLLTSEAEVRDRMRGLKTGADDYVGKPYDIAYVLGRARQLVSKTQPDLQAASTQLLVIDGDRHFLETLSAVLDRDGYSVATAITGEEGLRYAIATLPKAVIVGETPPGGIDGTTLIRRMKQDVALRHTPCILLTSAQSRTEELRALESGADAYVGKETDLSALLARITAALRFGSTPSSATDTSSSLLSPKKILAVDDSETYLQLVAAELRAEGYDIILARSGKEALQLLEIQSVDCILMDVMMPGMSGYETCRAIKSRPEWQDIPLLMLTALAERQGLIEGIQAGADDYIPKSNDFEVLRARLRAQLRRKQYEDENRRIRQELLQRELEATQARAAQEIAETRAVMSEELERKNRELEAFSYSVSHDLRAPLRTILGFSQILLEDFADQLPLEAKEHVQRISSASDRMAQLIDDLLELSRVSRSELHRQTVELTRLSHGVAAELKRREPHRRVRWAIEEGLVAEGDTRLLRIVLENLIGNAWKFTGKTENALIEIGSEMANGSVAYFVRDNGAGFDMTYAKRLFGPFQRLHAESDFPGTGIGLATVYRIVERHGGRAWGEGAVGKGATFFFTLKPEATEGQA